MKESTKYIEQQRINLIERMMRSYKKGIYNKNRQSFDDFKKWFDLEIITLKEIAETRTAKEDIKELIDRFNHFSNELDKYLSRV